MPIIGSSAAVGLGTGLSDVQFESMQVYLNSNVLGAPITGGIYSSLANAPSTLLAAFVSQTVSVIGTTQLHTFVTATPYTLEASTNYWFVLANGGINTLVWQAHGVSGTPPTAASGYTSLGAQMQIAPPLWLAALTSPAVEITVSSVPEPGTISLITAGIVAIGYVRRRRRA